MFMCAHVETFTQTQEMIYDAKFAINSAVIHPLGSLSGGYQGSIESLLCAKHTIRPVVIIGHQWQ